MPKSTAATRRRQYMIDLLTNDKEKTVKDIQTIRESDTPVNIMDIEHGLERIDVFSRELTRLQKMQSQ